jgi:hypothetical protein
MPDGELRLGMGKWCARENVPDLRLYPILVLSVSTATPLISPNAPLQSFRCIDTQPVCVRGVVVHAIRLRNYFRNSVVHTAFKAGFWTKLNNNTACLSQINPDIVRNSGVTL